MWNWGGPREAIPTLKRAIELKPECLQAHDYLGTAYLKKGEREGGMEHFRILKILDAKFEGVLSKHLVLERKEAAND